MGHRKAACGLGLLCTSTVSAAVSWHHYPLVVPRAITVVGREL